MKIFLIEKQLTKTLESLENSDFYKFLNKTQNQNFDVEKRVKEIIDEVKKNGDAALISYSNQFDKTNFSSGKDLIFSEKEIENSQNLVDKKVAKALKMAFVRIKAYHQKQLPKDFYFKDKTGAELGNCWRAVDSAGIYVPGGTASYPSSVLMSVVPALVCGVKEIAICAPTNGGKINEAVLFAAKICGVKKIYKIGGSQAIAALAYGTKTVKKVNKIVGPGNAYVACAKKIIFGEAGIDSIAGPSDITIIAQKNVISATWVAADALSQLEHGVDSKAFVITDSEAFAKEILTEISALKRKLPRQKIIDESLKNSAIFVIKNIDEAAELANFIAPEHLEIATKNPKKFLPKIRNAGAIFLGNYTPETIGDYMAGPSHTLPTEGTAKFSSGLSVFDFLKRISLISCDKNSFAKLAEATSALAACEGLDAHKLSVEIRRKN